MSSISPASTNPFDQDIELDEKAPDLSEHFLEKIDHKTLQKVKLVGSLLYFLASIPLVFGLNELFGFAGFTFGMCHVVFAEIVFLINLDSPHVMVWHKGYRDEIRDKLENKEITLSSFLADHTWQEIRLWGLYLSDNQHPLVTKQILINSLFRSSYSLYPSNTIYQQRSGKFNQSLWKENKESILEQFANNNVQFDEEHKKEFEEKYFYYINDADSDFKLLKDLNALQKLGLLKKLDKERIERLESKKQQYDKIWVQYNEARKNLSTNILSAIHLDDICGIGHQYDVEACQTFSFNEYAKKSAMINDWFVKQCGALNR